MKLKFSKFFRKKKAPLEFDPELVKLIRKSTPNLLALDIIGVQPIGDPVGLIFRCQEKRETYNTFQKFLRRLKRIINKLRLKNQWGYKQSLQAKWFEYSVGSSLGLTQKISIESIKDLNQSAGWKAFIALYQTGDTVWKYNNIAFLAGRSGYVIYRGKSEIGNFICMMS